jgi:hypothetical protein
MSSEFDQYFQEFLADDYNEFDIFRDDLGRGDGQLQDRAESSFDPTPHEDFIAPSLTSNTGTTNPALWRETLLPKTDSG